MLLPLIAVAALRVPHAEAQVMTRPQVANLIVKVENGVDDFGDFVKKRGENARTAASSPQAQSRRSRRGTPTETRKANAQATKDDLENALDDLNRSTNRLRRKFDATDAWMQTKVQVEQVMDDARRINQVVARGNYGAEAARLWAVLRSGINDLARAYGLQPMAV
jgi:hypothetical protein